MLNERKKRNKLILCSGAHKDQVKLIFNYFNFFDDYYGSSEDINLVGKNKSNFLVENYGKNNFDYIGNSFIDLDVWKESRNIYLGKTVNYNDEGQGESRVMEPLVLGQKLVDILTDIVDCLSKAHIFTPSGATVPIIDFEKKSLSEKDGKGNPMEIQYIPDALLYGIEEFTSGKKGEGYVDYSKKEHPTGFYDPKTRQNPVINTDKFIQGYIQSNAF